MSGSDHPGGTDDGTSTIMYVIMDIPNTTVPRPRVRDTFEEAVVGRIPHCAEDGNPAISGHWSHCTRKLSYRKDDRAMSPIHGCQLKFSRVPDYTHGYFSLNFNGLLFRSILRMCVQKLKFVALPVPEIIRGTQKIWTVPGKSTLFFVQNL